MKKKYLNKEEWIENIICSVENINKKEVNPYFFTRIKSRIDIERKTNFISIPKIVSIFSIILILFILNLSLIKIDVSTSSSINLNKPNFQTQSIPEQVNPYLEFLINY